jgi:hypothetical protein
MNPYYDANASQGVLLEQLYIQADEANAQFSEEYARRFPGATPFSGGNCYDAVRLIEQSLRSGVSLENSHFILRSYGNL